MSQSIVKALTILVFAYRHHWNTLIMYYSHENKANTQEEAYFRMHF